MLDSLHRCHLLGYEKLTTQESPFIWGSCIYQLSADVHSAAPTSLVRLETSHTKGGGCRMVGVSRKAYDNSKPSPSLLCFPSGLRTFTPDEEEAPPRWFLTRSVGVWGQHRTMYGECISCTLQPALYESLVRWDLMLTCSLFIASHESRLGSIHHFQAQPEPLPQARATSPWRGTKAGDDRRYWMNQRANAKITRAS